MKPVLTLWLFLRFKLSNYLKHVKGQLILLNTVTLYPNKLLSIKTWDKPQILFIQPFKIYSKRNLLGIQLNFLCEEAGRCS